MTQARRLVAALALALLNAGTADEVRAQGPPSPGAKPPAVGVDAARDSARALRGETLEVFLLTFGPGNAVFERFGHNALALRDTLSGESFAYNWGMFDFDQPNFLRRFLTGDTQYWLGVFRTPELLAAYREDNRSIRVQRLALSPAERGALFEFVRWNSDGENAFYRYDYYQDNCSTRVRDALDHVLGGQLAAELDVAGGGRTWRNETRRLLAGHLPSYAGIQSALGRHADRPLTRWEEGFLPEHLADAVVGIELGTVDGRRAPLVVEDSVHFRAERRPMPTEAPPWFPMAALLGLSLVGLIAVLADSRFAGARVLLMTIVSLWYLVTGVAGTALLLAATVTKHEPYMGANTTLLAMNPLAFVAMIVVPIALWRGLRTRVALGTTAGIALLATTAALLQLVPALRQESGELLAVVVPVQVALFLAVLRLHPRLAEHGATTR
jgi:hypothetical protein